MKPLARTVAHFCDTLARLPDNAEPFAGLDRRTEPSALYELAVEIHQHLVHLGASIDELRRGTVTSTQRSLHQIQCAYRSLLGLMIGVPDRLLDLHPPSERPAIRHLLQMTLARYRMDTPAASPSSSVAPGPCRDPLSTVFERGELIHRSLIDGLCGMADRMPHAPATRCALPALHLGAWLGCLEWDLLTSQVELDVLLHNAGHRRTAPMRLAHRIFSALGHLEGAMIGAETRFESACQPLIDFIEARTNELGRYC